MNNDRDDPHGLCLLLSCPFRVVVHTGRADPVLPIRFCENNGLWLLRLCHKIHRASTFFFCITFLGRASPMFNSFWKASHRGELRLLINSGTKLPALWVTHLTSGSFNCCQVFRWLRLKLWLKSLFWLQPHESPRTWITHSSGSYICPTKPLWYNKYLLLFEAVICYIVIEK